MTELQLMKSNYIHQLEVLFCVQGKSINIDDLTTTLNVEPIQVIRFNDERRRKSTGEVLGYYTENHWVFSSYPSVQDPDINIHLEWLLTKIRPHKEFLRLLQQESAEIFIEISCKLDDRFLSTSYMLDKRNLAEISELGVDMGYVFIRASNQQT